MVSVSNDQKLPWYVLVEREGDHGKGGKFYSACATESDAQEMCAAMNAQAKIDAQNWASKGQDRRYGYTIHRNTPELRKRLGSE